MVKIIKQIDLVQFRNYSTASFLFPEGVTCISGPNGSGKTNLLDAIYYLCYTKSYFSAYQQSCATMGTNGFRITGVFTNNDSTEKISCKWQAGKKEVFLNDAPYEKITDHIGKYAAVFIAPDDTEWLNGSSEHRRRWIDGVLCQTNRTYMEHLFTYQKVLVQRNAWLKSEYIRPTNNFAAIDYYDHMLSETGTYIFAQRQEFIACFLPLLRNIYNKIANGKEEALMEYASDIHELPMNKLLHLNLEHDLRLQRTTKGIHRDDLNCSIGNLNARQFASQGQKKTLLFSLKLAQYNYLQMSLGFYPLLLLDDIFEKLDQQRMEALMATIGSDNYGKVLLTDTHPERVSDAFGSQSNVGFIRL